MSYKSKTRAFKGLDALRNLVSDSMAIDMGSASTIVYVRGRGVVIDEPSLVAVNTITGEVIAIGTAAQKILGREGRDISVIAPMVNGVVADFEKTRAMLAHFAREGFADDRNLRRRERVVRIKHATTAQRQLNSLEVIDAHAIEGDVDLAVWFAVHPHRITASTTRERNRVSVCNSLHTRNCFESFEQLTLEFDPALGRDIQTSKTHSRDEQAFLIKSGVDGEKLVQAAGEQKRTCNQHQRERDLNHD